MNVKQFNPKYDFEILGATYIESPKSNCILFVGKKIASHIVHLEQAYQCLVFVEEGVEIPDHFGKDNCIKFSPNPSRDYAMAARMIWEERQDSNKYRTHNLAKDGYWYGENVQIGKDVLIQPGAFIDHDVIIGDGTSILSGARISNSTLGSGCIIKQNAVVGGYGFTIANDDSGNRMRIPSLGKVCIGDSVEIGSFSTVCCGTGNDTILGNYVKIDDHVHIGHDIKIESNVEIAAGSIIGGYCLIKENCFIGLNATTKNRIVIGKNTVIGMGSVVTQNVDDNLTVFGNPARIIRVPKMD